MFRTNSLLEGSSWSPDALMREQRGAAARAPPVWLPRNIPFPKKLADAYTMRVDDQQRLVVFGP